MARIKKTDGAYPLNIQLVARDDDPSFAQELRDYCLKHRYTLGDITYKVLRRFLDKKKQK